MATKPTLVTIGAGSQIKASELNDNFETLAEAIENGLGRGGVAESPNSMQGTLDMDLNRIQNLGAPTALYDAVRLVDVADASAESTATAQLRLDLANTTDPTLGSALVGNNVRKVDTVADLRELEGRYDGDVAVTLGYTTSTDGGFGVYTWDSGNKSNQISGDVSSQIFVALTAAPTGSSGAWVKRHGFYTEPFEITVGASGAYTTLNAALKHLGNIKPAKTDTVIDEGTRTLNSINVRLLVGFIMAEQVHLVNQDLGHIAVTTDEVSGVVPVTRSALTERFSARALWDDYPLFGANGSTLPFFDQIIFEMDSSGDGTGRHGVVMNEGSRLFTGYNCGIRNAGGHGLYASYRSNANIMNFDVSGAGEVGFYIRHDCNIHCRNLVKAEGLNQYAILTEMGSTFTILGGVSFIGAAGFTGPSFVRALTGSKIVISASNIYPDKAERLLSAPASSVVYADPSAEICLLDGVYVEGTSATFSVLAADGGRIIAPGVNLSGTTEQRGIRVFNSGYVSAPGATFGTKSVTDVLQEDDGVIKGQSNKKSFTISTIGLSVEQSGTAYYEKNGNQVTLQIPTLSGTSNSTVFSLTNLPAEIRPSALIDYLLASVRDNGNYQVGLIRVRDTGALSLYANLSASAWTASGTKAINGTTVNYLV